MKPQEALSLLDHLTSQMTLTRPQHEQVVQALNTLQTAITPKPDPKTNKDMPF